MNPSGASAMSCRTSTHSAFSTRAGVMR
jgi:hypothetical protein